MEFQQKIIDRSGLGDETGLSDGMYALAKIGLYLSVCCLQKFARLYLMATIPAGILAMQHGPLATSMQAAMAETQEVIFSVVEELLKKTQVNAKEVMTALQMYRISNRIP